MVKDSNYSLYKVLKSLTSGANSHSSIIDRNIKELHDALLHGVVLHQFRQGLKLLLD
ncbi:MAG: hypothetical protein HWN81_01830 [Candidatus Lokiarchaeota archaeon]|nr:hypothetical protein [Candidatus Lokiarchaeota archaeon]